MSASERFFRRYIRSTVGIIALFLAVNMALIASYFAAAYLGNMARSNFPIEEFSNHIGAENGQLAGDAQAAEMLKQAEAWAMILNDDGKVLWEENLPEELPRRYSATDIAMFSRWYLDDYPVNIWKRQDGLLVIGLPAGSVLNYYFSFKAQYVRPFLFGLTAVFCINVLLMIYLFIRNARRVEKAMGPILDGIRSLSSGKPVRLEETGELAEINAGLNRAGDYLLKKDHTRGEWIRGISHDIRTPLSLILGYASEIEDTLSLPETARKQAGIIRRHGEKLKNLVADLNLTTKLEYSIGSVEMRRFDPADLAHQAVGDILNDGISELYKLELREEHLGENIAVAGDPALLGRMLRNLIRNCIVHNPNGCEIRVSVGSNDTSCAFTVTDNGHGVSEPQLKALNSGQDISSAQKQTGEAEHGLGLKIVRQIVKAHQGAIQFSETTPHGLNVTVRLPLRE